MRKLKNLTKRALAVLLSILTFFTTIGIAPEKETEAAALAPKLVSPIALYNKSAEYGGYCYTSGGPDHYILLPTAEQLAKEMKDLYYRFDYRGDLDSNFDLAEFELTNLKPSGRTYLTRTSSRYSSWSDWSELVTQMQNGGLDMTKIATLEWLQATENYEGVMRKFHSHTAACYPAGAKQHTYHDGVSELNYIKTFDMANGVYRNEVYTWDFKTGRYYGGAGNNNRRLPVNNGCYTFTPTESGVKSGEEHHLWAWTSDCGDNVTGITRCWSCGADYGDEGFTDVEYEQFTCIACGKTCTFKPIQRCGVCGAAWNGTGNGEQSSPEEVDGSPCGATNRFFKFSLDCGKMLGHWYVGDTEVEPLCHRDEVVAVVPLVDMSQTVYVAPGETPKIPCRVYYTTGQVLDMEVPIEFDPDNTDLQANTTIRVGQRHVVQVYTYMTYDPRTTGIRSEDDYFQRYVGYRCCFAAPNVNKSMSYVSYNEVAGTPGSYVQYNGPKALSFFTGGSDAGYTPCKTECGIATWNEPGNQWGGGWKYFTNPDAEIAEMIGIAPERETEAAALAPKLVSPIALYNKSAEYGGYCYTSGGPDHYILLPTAEPTQGRGRGGMCPPPKFRKELGIIRHSLYLKLLF
ncbi:MAG: hypothetical protein MJ124_08160 [Lachnospiraceae bacterium]|nr:hypothetical protein [Lachnospiraceae bacterium]